MNILSMVAVFTGKADDSRYLVGMSIGGALAGAGDMLYSGKRYWNQRAQAPYVDAEESLSLAKK